MSGETPAQHCSCWLGTSATHGDSERRKACAVHVEAPEPSAGSRLREHELKTWPDFFRRVVSGEKTFEIRKDDRGFRGGDVLWLREYVNRTDSYTGRELRVRVTYLLAGEWPGLQPGYVAMAISPPISEQAAGDAPVPGERPPQWQPIRTDERLPEDGQRVLIWMPNYLGGYWRETKYLDLRMPGPSFEGYYGPWPTWWTPMLPAPPDGSAP
jgi:hypothetical protein